MRNYEYIRYIGVVKEESKQDMYHNATVLVSPTDCDIFPLTVLEALSYGTYVILSDKLKGAFDEFERIGVVRYCHNDPISFYKEIRDLLVNKKPFPENETLRLLNNYSNKDISRKLFREFDKTLCENHKQDSL